MSRSALPRVCLLCVGSVALALDNPLNSLQQLIVDLPTLFSGDANPAAPEDLQSAIQQIVQETCSFWNVTGCSVAVSVNGSDVLSTFGMADLERQVPVAADTLFEIGSTTKAYTTMALLQQVQAGKLDLDVPVTKYMPEIRLNASGSETMSLRDMMSHRTGLPRHDLLWAYMLPQSTSKTARMDLVSRFPGLAFDKPVRYRWEYNNLMVATAGFIAGKDHPEGWEGVVGERILRPLKMSDTWLGIGNLSEGAKERLATPYYDAQNARKAISERLHTALIAPAGAIISSPQEQLKWLKAHLAELSGLTPLINTSTAAQLLEPNALTRMVNPRLGSYTLGWWFEQLTTDIYLLHHGGNTQGFSAYNALVLRLPNQVLGGGRAEPLAAISIHTNQQASTAPLMLTLQLTALVARLPIIRNLNALQFQAMALQLAQAAAARKEIASCIERGKTDEPSQFSAEQLKGTYQNPTYGRLTLELTSQGGLAVSANRQDAKPVLHFCKDIFGVKAVSSDDWTDPTVQQVEFVGAKGGQAESLITTLEPTVAPIEFQRVPETLIAIVA